MKLSLRLRLTFWFTAIVAFSLALFGLLNYVTVSSELNQNLDSSILSVAESLRYTIEQKQQETNQPLQVPRPSRKPSKQEEDPFAWLLIDSLGEFIGPILPPPDTVEVEKQPEVVWSAVYKHILLNSKDYFIQIADSTNEIVWRSENMRPSAENTITLPMAAEIQAEIDSTNTYQEIVQFELDGEKVRAVVLMSPHVQITVAYPMFEVEATLNDLFSSLIIALPGILLISTMGGWFLARYSLQPIELLNYEAKEITASSLSKRLPVPQVNDEIARLTVTLNDMISRLEKSFLQVRQFTSDASHELQTPLSILIGELEIALRSPKSTEEYEEILSSALEEVLRLSKVVKNLLQLSRAESGEMKLRLEPIDIGLLLEDVFEDALILCEEKHIDVECKGAESIVVTGERAQLHQALLNLVENAIKYSYERGALCLEQLTHADYVYINITDTGMGIPAKDLDHIFDRFYRVDKARSQSVSGHGLGLSIVQSIIRAHGGSISVSSRVGQGTTFQIRLPRPKT